MLAQAKRVVLGAIGATGMSHVISSSRWRNGRLLVLCYHGVSISDEHSSELGLHISPQFFEARLQALSDGGYNVLPLDEGLSLLRSGGLPKKAVVLTFDDGFADFALRAAPLLKKFGFPATLYLTTYYVFFNRPLFNLVVPHMLWRSRDQRVGPNPAIGWTTAPGLANPEGRAAAWRLVGNLAEERGMSAQAKDELAAEVAAHLNLDYGALCSERILSLMRPDEVSKISANGISVELHTHRHRTPRDSRLFSNEIEENRRHILDLTGVAPNHFCYPSGVHRGEMLPWLRQAGVQSATTCEAGLASAATEPLLTPRFVDHEHVPPPVFDGWLTGACEMIAAIKPRASAAAD